MGNMQSQSPLRSTRLDFIAKELGSTTRIGIQNKIQEESSANIAAGMYPPLKDHMITESLQSSAQHKKRRKSGAHTPGQNWEH